MTDHIEKAPLAAKCYGVQWGLRDLGLEVEIAKIVALPIARGRGRISLGAIASTTRIAMRENRVHYTDADAGLAMMQMQQLVERDIVERAMWIHEKGVEPVFVFDTDAPALDSFGLSKRDEARALGGIVVHGVWMLVMGGMQELHREIAKRSAPENRGAIH